MKYVITGIIFFLITYVASAQVTTMDDVINAALSNDPQIRMADYEVGENKALEKTAFDPNQPSFGIEFPTDVGIGFEAEQNFSFPTVYTRKSKWLKSQTSLSEEAAVITREKRVRDLRLLYLEAQVSQKQIENHIYLDSLWREIAEKSKALYDGGEINKADLLFAERQSSINYFALLQARVEYENLLATLSRYAGIPIQEVTDLSADTMAMYDSTGVFYFQKYQQQQLDVIENEMKWHQAERLPGLSVGYLKVSEVDTEFRYRYKAGITIPIWQSQYTGLIEANKVQMEQRKVSAEMELRDAEISRNQWLTRLRQTRNAVTFFEQTALPQMKELITTYRRLFEGGELDYALTLKNIAEVVSTHDQYLDVLEGHQEAIIQLDFLNGQD